MFLARIFSVVTLGGIGILLAGCGAPAPAPQPAENTAEKAANTPESSSKPAVSGQPAATAQPVTPRPQPQLVPGEHAGLHRLVRITPEVYSGGEPEGEIAFQTLRELGIKTLVSVDGAPPDVELAAKYQLKYVHIPIGYHGVPPSARQLLAKAAREVERPIYFHCHHGQHRGPAAAAVACVACELATSDEALQILKVAGTGNNYTGLWKAVRESTPLVPAADTPALVATATVASFPAAMADLDRHFGHLQLCKEAKWSVPDDHPDLVASKEAQQLVAGLEASAMHLGAQHNDDFRALLAGSTEQAKLLHAALMAGDLESADARFVTLQKSCKACHAKYRDTVD